MKMRNFMEIPSSEGDGVRVQLITDERPCFGIQSCRIRVTVVKVIHKAVAIVEYRHDRQEVGWRVVNSKRQVAITK